MPHFRLFLCCFVVLIGCKEVALEPPGGLCDESSFFSASTSPQSTLPSYQLKQNRYIVALDGLGTEEARLFLEENGAFAVRPILTHGKLGRNLYAVDILDDDQEKIRGNPNVRYLEPVGMVHVTDEQKDAHVTTKCTLVGEEFIPTGIVKLQAPDVWSKTRGQGVVAIVIDSGISKGHPDFSEDQIIGGKCVYFECLSPDDIDDTLGHGTHVAGTIAAKENGVGVVGMAPDVSLYIIRIFDETGSTSHEEVVAGLDEALRFAQENPTTPIVVNMSFGGGGSKGIQEAISALAEENVILVASAGNSGDGDAGSSEEMGMPASLPEVIAVGAVSTTAIAYFSTNNEKVELSAPGVGIISDMPASTVGSLNGTSMASPHVAGAVALLLAENLTIQGMCHSAKCIRQILATTAQDYGPPGHDIAFGHGEPRMVPAFQAINNQIHCW